MSYLFKQEEIGDYRISIYQDEYAECPCLVTPAMESSTTTQTS